MVGRKYKIYTNIDDAWHRYIPQGIEMIAEGRGWFTAVYENCIYVPGDDEPNNRFYFVDTTECELVE